MRGTRAAFIFLSRLPLGGFPYRTRDWHWAPAHFPLVGIVVGAVAAAVFHLSTRASLGPLLSATLSVGSSVWLTGAFHEDGLADSADGLGGAHGGKSALEIMKDSRIGTYGAVALLFSVLIRIAAVAELGSAWFTFVCVHCLARVGPVWLMASMPYVGDAAHAKTRHLFDTRAPQVVTASAWAVLCSALGAVMGWISIPATLGLSVVLVVTTLACARHYRKAVGGITGDLLGAAEQVAEIAGWITLLGLRSL